MSESVDDLRKEYELLANEQNAIARELTKRMTAYASWAHKQGLRLQKIQAREQEIHALVQALGVLPVEDNR